jgi:putative transcriptional regulator
LQRSYLRHSRKKCGLTLEDLSKEIQISRQTLGNIESGRRDPSWDVAQKLEAFFKVKASKLLKRDGEDEQ